MGLIDKIKENLEEIGNFIKEIRDDFKALMSFDMLKNELNGIWDAFIGRINDDTDFIKKIYKKKIFPSVIGALYNATYKEILSKNINWKDLNNSKIFNLINKLPKIDLHCHLGGCARKQDLVDIAKTFPKKLDLEQKIEDFFKGHNYNEIKKLFRNEPKFIAQKIYSINNLNNIKAIHYANIIQFLSDKDNIFLLDSLYEFDNSLNGISHLIKDNLPTKFFSGIGLKNYLKLGNWGGSTLLQTHAAIEKAIECLCKFGREHNLRYLELRFNPLKYSREKLTPEDVYNIIKNSILQYQENIIINIIFIAGKPKGIDNIALLNYKKHLIDLIILFEKIYRMQEKSKNKSEPRIVGFDLAGLEDYFNQTIRYGSSDIIAATREELFPLFDKNIFITIHCGETQIDKRLSEYEIKAWNRSVNNAVFQFGANRLGHALKFSKSFCQIISRNNITIELCPSSNCQVSSFLKTPWVNLTRNKKSFENQKNKNTFTEYPISRYIKNDINICINTDNPSISKTNWTRELFLASELSSEPLNVEKIIKIIYNGLQGAFLLKLEREDLEYILDQEIMEILKEFS